MVLFPQRELWRFRQYKPGLPLSVPVFFVFLSGDALRTNSRDSRTVIKGVGDVLRRQTYAVRRERNIKNGETEKIQPSEGSTGGR